MLKKHIAWIYFLGLLMLAQYYLNNSMQNNVNSMQTCLMLFSAFLLEKKKDFLASFILAFVIAIKIVPAVLLAYFLYRRKIKAIFYTAFFTLFFSLIPFGVWDFETNYRMLQDWALVLADKGHFPFYKWTNQAPYALAFRWSGNELFSKLYSWGDSLGMLILLFLMRKRSAPFFLSLSFMSLLIMSPVVWIEYYLVLTFPILYLLTCAFESIQARAWYVLLIVRSLFLLLAGKFLIGAFWAEKFNSLGIHYFSLIVLLILFLTMDERPTAESSKFLYK